MNSDKQPSQIIQPNAEDSKNTNPFTLDGNGSLAQKVDFSASAPDQNVKLNQPVVLAMNNTPQYDFIRMPFMQPRVPNVFNQDPNIQNTYQQYPQMAPQGIVFANHPETQLGGQPQNIPQNCYLMPVTAQQYAESARHDRNRSPSVLISTSQPNQQFQHPNMLQCGAIRPQYIQNTPSRGSETPAPSPVLQQNFMDNQSFSVQPRVATPVNASSPMQTTPVNSYVMQQHPTNVFQRTEAPEAAQNMAQTQFDPLNLQPKISMVLSQIAQVQANLGALNTSNSPQAAQIFQFLTNRHQQLKAIYYQLMLQQQQSRTLMLPPQLSNNPNALALLQQQMALNNQAQGGQGPPRVGMVNPLQMRMGQPMMMPPGLARFQTRQMSNMIPGFQTGVPRPFMDMSRTRRVAPRSRRRRQYSSESEEEEELSSSDAESPSQITLSEVPLEDMELRRSARRRSIKSYANEFDEDSDAEEKSRREAEAALTGAQDLVPFQPLDQGEGKIMLIERVLADRYRPAEDDDDPSLIEECRVPEFLVKFKCFSYLHCEWLNSIELRKRDRNALSKLKRFRAKKIESPFLFLDDDPFNPDYIEVDRVLDEKSTPDPTRPGERTACYLVKWCSLPYDESTWEFEEVVDEVCVTEFRIRNTPLTPELSLYKPRPPTYQWQKLQQSPPYKNANSLRDYQLEGINWLSYEYYMGANCILADEMGLGKTIQSIAFLIEVRRLGIRGPFLVIAPLSTIGNWYREFRQWADFNVVVLHGSAAARNVIHRYELFYRDNSGNPIDGPLKVEVLVTTYEMVLAENKFLSSVRWRVAIVDEAHRLKNRKCKLLENLSNISIEHRVLLTGTPLQNTLDELLSLLNFLEPARADALEQVMLQHGGRLETNVQVQQIQAFLKPVILRRLKEDVEKCIAPKEETIIEVEMTAIQKKVYRGVLERNLSFLTRGSSSTNLPNLMNIMMELRKCCNHPFLINGVEDKILAEYGEANPDLSRGALFQKSLVEASGKMVLVDKLLPRLRQDGHKMLVFSQMVRVLDIIEEYLVANNFQFERIDGGVRGNLRQAAIDRFSKPDSDRTVFLLCTKAGGLGINLTAADTVIIFDSDWNPQNDIQAQARCHRIGQNRPVKVYRLVCRKTYEREMFDRASLKLGLDRAVLQDMTYGADATTTLSGARTQLTKKEVEELLRRGAYAAVMDEDTEASARFCAEDIEQILERRATVVQVAGAVRGSTFAKASFNADTGDDQVDIDDPDFWQKWARSAKVVPAETTLIDDRPRVRKQVRNLDGYSDVELEFNRRAPPRTSWLKKECVRVERQLLIHGWGRWAEILHSGGFKSSVGLHDVEQISRTVVVAAWHLSKTPDKPLTDFVEKAMRISALKHRHSDVEDLNYRPYGKRSRNRKKERGKKGDKPRLCLIQTAGDWKSLDVDTLILDPGYKKHLAHCANRILIRLRLLFYIEYYMLRGCKEDALQGVAVEDLTVTLPSPARSNLVLPPWWDAICDRSLIVGTFKHGYEQYSLMRSDRQLCFHKHLVAEARPDATDSIKRRGRKKKVVNAGSDDEAEEIRLSDFPSDADLNTYLKRLFSAYWKDRSKGHSKELSSEVRSKWMRKEENDFCRVLTNFGLERDNECVLWENFRRLGKFERKDDIMLSQYLDTFLQRCQTLLSETPVNGSENPTDTFLTVEKAEKLLHRIELFDSLRMALHLPNILEVLPTAPRNVEFPDWWTSEHDFELMKAASTLGIDQLERRLPEDPNYCFLSLIQRIYQEVITSNEFFSQPETAEDPSVDSLKFAVRWPRNKILIDRIYGLSMLATTATWYDRFEGDQPTRSFKKSQAENANNNSAELPVSQDVTLEEIPVQSLPLEPSQELLLNDEQSQVVPPSEAEHIA